MALSTNVEVCVSGTVLANADVFSVAKNTATPLDVLANDYINGMQGGTPNIVPRVTVPPAHGTVAWNAATNKFDYTPNNNYTGQDSFEYELTALYHANLRFETFYEEGTPGITAALEELLPGFVWGTTQYFYLGVATKQYRFVYVSNNNGSGYTRDYTWGPDGTTALPEVFCVPATIGMSFPPQDRILLSNDMTIDQEEE